MVAKYSSPSVAVVAGEYFVDEIPTDQLIKIEASTNS